jgi:gamma-glutamyltranspeptidase / glutathione hydrolase
MFLRSKLLASAVTTFAAITLAASPADAAPKVPPKDPIAVGHGGAVSSVDPYATEIGLNVLRRGGNAVDAAVGESPPRWWGFG